MTLPFHIVEMLKQRSGNDLHLPSSCQQLALDMERKTGAHIGATTLKRLLGFVADDRKTYESTLDIIARYLGFSHWQQLSELQGDGNSGFDDFFGEVRSDKLSLGDYLRIAYLPDREVLLHYLGNHRYRVVESLHSKLQPLDEIDVENFVLHYPLLVSHVWRNRDDLGPFTAGGTGGLISITINP